MSLEDHQTCKEIVNPYISIKGVNRDYAVNTETFRNCQNWLITPRTKDRDLTSDLFQQRAGNGRTASVFAVVGDYNEFVYGITRTVSIARPSIRIESLGEIPLAILQTEIPKVYDGIREEMEKIAREKSS